jgi:hypothetical protein
LPCIIHYFAFCVTGLFSVCSQLWERKNAKVFPLLSVSSQLWEIQGKRTKYQQGIAGVEAPASEIHGNLLQFILAYCDIDVKRKMRGKREIRRNAGPGSVIRRPETTAPETEFCTTAHPCN